MRQTLSIPPQATELILLQRTQLQSPMFKFLRKLGFSYHPTVCRLESRLRQRGIVQSFLGTLVEDMTEIAPHLPNCAPRILDIGCGVAGIDVLLHDHYAAQRPEFWLLDKSVVSKRVFYDFHRETAFYNSLDAARAVLEGNGVPPAAIHCVEVADNPARITEPATANLVVSLLSWGFHYPVETYLAEVKRLLAVGGRVIIDVRKDNDGIQRLHGTFKQVTVIANRPRNWRIVAGD